MEFPFGIGCWDPRSQKRAWGTLQFVAYSALAALPEVTQRTAGSAEVDENGFRSATAFYGSATLPFVIPSAAEGPAVPRTSLGNVSLLPLVTAEHIFE